VCSSVRSYKPHERAFVPRRCPAARPRAARPNLNRLGRTRRAASGSRRIEARVVPRTEDDLPVRSAQCAQLWASALSPSYEPMRCLPRRHDRRVDRTRQADRQGATGGSAGRDRPIDSARPHRRTTVVHRISLGGDATDRTVHARGWTPRMVIHSGLGECRAACLLVVARLCLSPLRPRQADRRFLEVSSLLGYRGGAGWTGVDRANGAQQIRQARRRHRRLVRQPPWRGEKRRWPTTSPDAPGIPLPARAPRELGNATNALGSRAMSPNAPDFDSFVLPRSGATGALAKRALEAVATCRDISFQGGFQWMIVQKNPQIPDKNPHRGLPGPRLLTRFDADFLGSTLLVLLETGAGSRAKLKCVRIIHGIIFSVGSRRQERRRPASTRMWHRPRRWPHHLSQTERRPCWCRPVGGPRLAGC
jgi:hypothetical protein